MNSDDPKVNENIQKKISEATDLLLECEVLLFTSGAGMGVGSGLGTFRGIGAGVWPPLLQHPDLDFTDMSNPSWFHKAQGNSLNHNTANFGYAFWAYRYESYTAAAPHRGYTIAKEWSSMPHIKSAFSFTSNIDGHWIKSGWKESNVIECHGSIDYMQCINNCSQKIWPTAETLKLQVDSTTNCVTDPLPSCPDCHELARPNVLMFGDWEFYDARRTEQVNRYNEFQKNLNETKSKLLIIELGAGTAVPTVRYESEKLFANSSWPASFIRVNPSSEHATIPAYRRTNSQGKAIEICLDALSALSLIDDALKEKLKN